MNRQIVPSGFTNTTQNSMTLPSEAPPIEVINISPHVKNERAVSLL